MSTSFIDKIVHSGEFQAYLIDDATGSKTLVYGTPNQIQYAGANLIARALVTPGALMPILTSIKTDVASSTDPGVSGPRYAEPPFTYGIEASGFVATPTTSLDSQQVVVCRAMFAGYYGIDRHYQFALVVNSTPGTLASGIALGYRYVPGGLSWGIGSSLSISWTIYLGAE